MNPVILRENGRPASSSSNHDDHYYCYCCSNNNRSNYTATDAPFCFAPYYYTERPLGGVLEPSPVKVS